MQSLMPSPDDRAEDRRVSRLLDLCMMDTPPEPEFDALVILAARLLNCPMAGISLVDRDRAWLKARHGLSITEVPREQAMCSHAIAGRDLMEVENLRDDPIFADNPLVVRQGGVQFYAGVPLRIAATHADGDASAVGTFCVMDTRPRSLTDADRTALRALAELAAALIRTREMAATALRLSDATRRQTIDLDRKHRQLRQAERMAGIGSWRLDLADQRVEWSEQVYAIYGLPVGDSPPLEAAMEPFPLADRERVAAFLEGAIERGESFDFESDFISAEGRYRRVRSIGEREMVNGKPAAVIGVFQDITEHHVQEQALRVSAHTDVLTGLANRAALQGRLQQAFDQAREQGKPLGLLLLDLDGFKAVNDTLGHDAGDAVLRVIAERIKGPSFAHCFVARLGGDEFVLLIERPRDCRAIRGTVQTLLRDLRHVEGEGANRRMISATIGGALLAEGDTTPADLLRRADVALYQAKGFRRGTGRLSGEDGPIRALGD